jgi:hypothetical protein
MIYGQAEPLHERNWSGLAVGEIRWEGEGVFLPHIFASNEGVILESYKLIIPKGSLARLHAATMSSVQHTHAAEKSVSSAESLPQKRRRNSERR